MYSYKETNIVAKSRDPCLNLTSACSQIQIVWLGYGMVDGKIVVRIPVVMTANFIFPKAPRPVMRLSLSSRQRVRGTLYPSRSGLGLKFAKRESSAEVKSCVELYRHSSTFFFMAFCLFKCRKYWLSNFKSTWCDNTFSAKCHTLLFSRGR